MLAQAVGRFLMQYKATARATRDCNMTALTIWNLIFQQVGSGVTYVSISHGLGE